VLGLEMVVVLGVALLTRVRSIPTEVPVGPRAGPELSDRQAAEMNG
jgi:hypothetical protein